jgi:hypothetical protein
MAHVARFPGRVGPTCSPLVALMPSIFILLDASWPKTIYKKGPAAAGRVALDALAKGMEDRAKSAAADALATAFLIVVTRVGER